MTDEQRANYHKQIETLLDVIAVSAIPPSRSGEVNDIREDHSWDGLSCSCGGGWLVGHAGGCLEGSSARLADAVQPAELKFEPVIRLDGIDEYGPLLSWFKAWTDFPIGTEFYPVLKAVSP